MNHGYSPVTLRLAEPNAVDNGGVVELIADHGVVGGQKRLKQARLL